MEELKGYVTDIIYRNAENCYSVFELRTPEFEITVTGAPTMLNVGDSLRISGEYREHPVYGEQFAGVTFESAPPEGAEAVERYLGSGAIKGIGAALAARIVKKFGEDTLRIMEEEPERLAEIKGISENKAREIAAQASEKRDLRDAMLFLQQYGITNRMAVRIYETYGLHLYGILRENPYKLAEDIDGIGFARADEIASRTGIAVDSDFRVRSGILYALTEVQENGSTCTTREELTAAAVNLLGVPAEVVEVQIDNLAIDRKLIIKRNEEGEAVVYGAFPYSCEQQTAKLLLDLDAAGVHTASSREIEEKITELEERQGILLDELQRDAVRLAASKAVLLISGGPGTGKTTTINTIIRYFLAEGLDVVLCAPTGRAAKRMSEATGYEAMTIHRLLGVKGIGGDMGKNADGSEKKENTAREFSRVSFERDADNPLEADAIIVDEMSMVDLFLFRALLKAIQPGTRLILVGDRNQLPSVGPGKVLEDLLASKCFSEVALKRIFRQAAESDIVMNAHAINEGKEIRLDNKSRDFFFLERKDPLVVYKHTVQLLRDKLPGYVNCAPEDIQVLTPMRKGMLGVEKLNEVLQSVLNPPAEGKREYKRGDLLFREGDKVMQTRNNYQLTWEIRGRYGIAVEKGQGIFNGDFGTIAEINESLQTMTVLFDENRVVEYPLQEADELDLAYAVTVHKSQGSEYPAVIIPLLSGPQALFHRNLLYTAVTRARKCVVILGSAHALQEMIDNAHGVRRRTGLKERIIELSELYTDY